MTHLKEQAFRKLSRELHKILSKAQKAATQEKIAGYWQAGARIAAQRLSEDAGYHNTILRELAQDIGISARTLQHAVLFHTVYSEPPADPLTWAHFRILVRLVSDKERAFYTKKCVTESWTVRDLEEALRADLYAGGAVKRPALPRPTDSSYVYRAEKPHLIDADTLEVDVDLGFQVWTRRRLRLARIDAPEAGTPKGRAAKNFVLSHLTRAQTLVLRTEKVDIHGRYIADVFLSPQRVDPSTCYETGSHLNALLVRAGHAKVV